MRNICWCMSLDCYQIRDRYEETRLSPSELTRLPTENVRTHDRSGSCQTICLHEHVVVDAHTQWLVQLQFCALLGPRNCSMCLKYGSRSSNKHALKHCYLNTTPVLILDCTSELFYCYEHGLNSVRLEIGKPDSLSMIGNSVRRGPNTQGRKQDKTFSSVVLKGRTRIQRTQRVLNFLARINHKRPFKEVTTISKSFPQQTKAAMPTKKRSTTKIQVESTIPSA